MLKYYLEDIGKVFADVKSSKEGLTSAQADERLAANGKNRLAQQQKESLVKRFFKQMADPMIIILLVAAGISAVLAVLEKDFPSDVIIILFVVIVNAILGVYQESKAEKALEALQEMSAATSKVLRDGKIVSVKSEDLVVGDVVLLEAGDSVPADCRIFECASMKIEEAALTGESVPVGKLIDTLMGKKEAEIPLGDRKNMVYMGSTVVYGRGSVVVVATGMETEMGKIADAIANAEEGQTPLQIKLAQLSKVLTFLVLGICVFIFAFDIIKQIVDTGAGSIGFENILDFFMVAVSLAVAAIPEGLVAVVTIVLSIGVTNMSKRNAIIRKLTAVETLGCAQIICSDKTGTLTQNKMTVVDHFGGDEGFLATAMALCSDAQRQSDGSTVGEPTEVALVNYAHSLSIEKNDLKEKYPRIGEAPFDSMRKMMSTVHSHDGEVIQFTKGAPDEVLKNCKFALVDGNVVAMSAEIHEKILNDNKRMADKALRVLAAAFKKYPSAPSSFEAAQLENELVFIGLTGMIDPVRPEVKAAIEQCSESGIRPIMITGDHRDTAVAIAMELGIIDNAENAITGAQLSEISDEDFARDVEKYSVYARVQPEHKTRIVNAWRNLGMVTAMTGDGVNDAPSIKSADIGVGMGITGTDVTKNVADMVLADDNFATIVSAVSEGRRIYDNIRKAIQFLLSSNLSEVLGIFISSMMGFVVLKPTHLLWINLVTDCFPALALGMEAPEKNLMKRKPRSPKDGVFSGGVAVDVLYQGFIVTMLTLSAYFIGNYLSVAELLREGVITQGIFDTIKSYSLTFFAVESDAIRGTLSSIPMVCSYGDVYSTAYEFIHANGMTMAFLTMSMCEIFHSFNMRSQRNSVLAMSVGGSHNKPLYLAMVASLVLTTVVIEVPVLASAFDFATIDIKEYAIALLLAFSVLPIVEVIKVFQRMAKKNK